MRGGKEREVAEEQEAARWRRKCESAAAGRGTCHTFRRPHSSPGTPKSHSLLPLTHKQTSTPTQPPPSAGSAGG
ncbi:hypothetical protein Q5P01_007815 [Channa striata]|uniref:Uncharacterized protein n=1 Tax=Channa striata TaxID=64152 RepID=A0AA88N8Z7_CHASR|nr:hypothetical protein Q5P01_007815 [Channa striata]